MAKRQKSDSDTSILQIRMPSEFYTQLSAEADALGLTVSGYARMVLQARTTSPVYSLVKETTGATNQDTESR